MTNLLNILLINSGWALLILRVVFGALFIAHGWPKIKSLKTNAQNFEMMGFKPGNFWGTIVAIVEFFGGLAIILGLYVQLAGLLLVINMGVATIWKIKRGHKFVGGFELELILATVGLALATLGGGLYGLDQFYPAY